MIIFNIIKIILYFIGSVIVVFLMINILGFIINEISTSKVILSDKNQTKTRIVCIYKDNNITIDDKNNDIYELEINNDAEVTIIINKNKVRNIYIKNQSVKLKTVKDSIRILSSTTKKMGRWMGIKIEDDCLKHFFIDNEKKFTFEPYHSNCNQ